MTPRLALPLIIALACLASLAPSASALTQTVYRVTVEGTASLQRTDIGPGAFGDWVQNQKAEFSWTSEFPTVTFIDNTVATAASPKITAPIKSASMDVSIPTPEGPLTGACSGSTWASQPSSGVITGQVEKPEDAQAEGIWIRVFNGGTIKMDSCSGALAPGPFTMPVDGEAAPGRVAPFMDFFEMPYEAIGMGKIIQLLEREVTGVNCPGWYDKTDSCTLKWKATVTFVRTFQLEVGEPEIGPAPPEEEENPLLLDPDDISLPPAPGPQPPPQPGPSVNDLDDLLLPIPGEAKLSRSGDSATFAVICPGGCSGIATATPLAGRGARASAARRPLARAKFVAQAGRRKTVRLRFKGAARRMVRRAGGVKVSVTAKSAGGRTERTTLTIRRGR